VIYPSSNIQGKLKLVLDINPMTGVVEGFRSALFGLPFHWDQILTSAVITVVVLAYAAFSFRRMEKKFADIV